MNSLREPLTSPPLLNGGSEPKKAGEGNDEKGFAARFPLRILIADDDYAGRRTLRFMIEGLGYAVESVENGQECLDAATTRPFDLVLLDLDMPVMDGAECARAMRHAKIGTSIVALTAVPVQVARLASLGAGINSYLEKPVKIDELKQALRVACFNRAFSG